MTITQNAETESFHSQCKRLGKNHNCKTVKIFNISQSKFILHNSSNKNKALTNQHIKPAPQKVPAAGDVPATTPTKQDALLQRISDQTNYLSAMKHCFTR